MPEPRGACSGLQELERLSEAEVTNFEQLVLDGYRQAFPVQQDGCVLLPFQRLFLIAHRTTAST